MKLLFIGDIVGRPGRDLVRRHLKALASLHRADLVIANGENAAGGAGITRDNANEILGAGVDVITTGNHVWDKRETLEFISQVPQLIRPANYPEGTPGLGSYLAKTRDGVLVGVVNVMGRVFLATIDDTRVRYGRPTSAISISRRVQFLSPLILHNDDQPHHHPRGVSRHLLPASHDVCAPHESPVRNQVVAAQAKEIRRTDRSPITFPPRSKYKVGWLARRVILNRKPVAQIVEYALPTHERDARGDCAEPHDGEQGNEPR